MAAIVPLILVLLAIAASAVVAYGTHPALGQWEHGLQVIMLSRRLQWPLAATAVVLCVTLVAMAIAGRQKLWWLVGLAPVVALFVHRFGPAQADAPTVAENPVLVEAAAAPSHAQPAPDDWVVAVSFNGRSIAFPYAALFRTPVVIQQDHDRRMVLLWSAYANRAVACELHGATRGRDLEVVGQPANGLLVYNGRVGQFVYGMTGATPDGKRPDGFGARLATTKMTFQQWSAANPGGALMPLDGSAVRGAVTAPLSPIYPLPAAADAPSVPRRQVALIGTTRPAVLSPVTMDQTPVNVRVDGEVAFAFRTSGERATVRAYDARFGDGFRSKFIPTPSRERKGTTASAAFKDVDSQSLWTTSGMCISSPAGLRGKRLTALIVDDQVDWAVAKFWMPELEVTAPQVPTAAVAGGTPAVNPEPSSPRSPATARRRAPPGTARGR